MPKKNNNKKINIKQIDTVVLSTDTTKITTIWHLADIHISRFEDRHPEYRLVFGRLYDRIKKSNRLDSSIVVICGDVLHEKNTMSPAQLLLAKEFFIMMADLCPVVMIIGNHDISPHGNTIDSITPILKNLNSRHKIHLLLECKNYIYNNIIFGVTDIFAKTATPCFDQTGRIKIGLYHGSIYGSTNNDGFRFTNNCTFKVDDFKKYYDYVLLGDIHKYGYLDENRTMAYSGSLIQTRFGEDLLDHGMLRWNLMDGSSKFIRIKNDWGYVKIKVDENGIVDPKMLDCIPKYPVIRVEYENISSMEAEKYLEELKQKYGAKCSLVRKVTQKIDCTVGRGKKQTKVIDISSNDQVVDLIMNFMKNNFEHEYAESKTDVRREICNILGSMEHNYCNQVKNFKLKTLKFSNFFNFGEGNTLDYTKMSGIVGITGNSYIGKSTASCDVLLYALYGKCSRGDKFDTININKKTMSTDIEFDINDDQYRITRERTLKGERTTLYKNNENVSRESVDRTNLEISKILCSYNNFINVAIMLQHGTVNQINMSDKDRKTMLCELLKLDVFNDVMTTAKTKICQINYYLGRLRGSQSKELYDKNKDNPDLLKNIQLVETEYQKINNQIINLTKIYENGKLHVVCSIEQLKANDWSSDSTDDMLIKQSELSHRRKELINQSDCLVCLKDKLFHHRIEQTNCTIRMKTFGDIDQRNQQFIQNKNQDIANLTIRLEQLLANRIPDQIDHSNDQLEQETSRNQKLHQMIGDLTDEIIALESKISHNVLDPKLTESYEMLKRSQNERNNIARNIKVLQEEHQQLIIRLNELSDHQYDPNCQFCAKYPTTQEKIKCTERIQQIEQHLIVENNHLIRIDHEINGRMKYEKMYQEYIERQKSVDVDLMLLQKKQFEQIVAKKDLEISCIKIQEHEHNKLNAIKNREIDGMCEEIRQKIEQRRMSVFDDIMEYNNCKTRKNILEINILQTKNKINEIERTVADLNRSIQLLEKECDDHQIRIEQMDRHKKIQIQIDQNNLFCENIKRELSEKMIVQNELYGKLLGMRMELDKNREIHNDYMEKEKEKNILELIVKVLDRNGLIDNILRTNVVPRLESDVNSLLEYMVDYRISISYLNGHFKINKINGEKIINIETLSGCERLITNICFKLALDQYNNHIKTKFIVLDEIFSCCDNNNLDKLPLIFNHIRNQYNFALIISHDERIKKLYDTSIEVFRLNEHSQISFQ
jgi:exonuclease SbcC